MATEEKVYFISDAYHNCEICKAEIITVFVDQSLTKRIEGQELCVECADWKEIWNSEAPLRAVESGKALEIHYDYLSSFDDPRSF